MEYTKVWDKTILETNDFLLVAVNIVVLFNFLLWIVFLT